MAFIWHCDAYSVAYVLLNLILVVMGLFFWRMSPTTVTLANVEMVDGPYISLLKHKFLDTTSPPAKVSLETLGSYEVFTKDPGAKPFGLQSTSLLMLPLFTSAKNVLMNDRITGQGDKLVVLASPLWAYEHNLHLHDSTYCSDNAMMQAVASNQLYVNPIGGPTAPLLDPVVYKCAPAYPTTVNYKKCYSELQEHKTVIAVYACIMLLVVLVCTCLYIHRGYHQHEGLGVVYTQYLQKISLLFHVIIFTVLSMSMNTGIPTISSDNGCPNKTTGTLQLYEIFLTIYLNVITVLFLHVGAILHDIKYGPTMIAEHKFGSEVEAIKQGQTNTGYSCQYPA